MEFIYFASGGSNLQLFLTQIYQANVGSFPPSPFILTNTAAGTSAAFDVSGYVLNNNDGSQTPFTGTFSATFSGMTVAELTSSLPVDTTFSATFSVTPIPEAASLLLVGVGLLGMGIVRRKKLGHN